MTVCSKVTIRERVCGAQAICMSTQRRGGVCRNSAEINCAPSKSADNPCSTRSKGWNEDCCTRIIDSAKTSRDPSEKPSNPSCSESKECGKGCCAQLNVSCEAFCVHTEDYSEGCYTTPKFSHNPCYASPIDSSKGSEDTRCAEVKESAGARCTLHKGSLDLCCDRRCCSAEPCCCSLKTSDDPCCNQTINTPQGPDDPCCVQVKETGGASYTQHKGSLDVSSGRRCCCAEPCCCSLKTSDDPCWNRTINSPKGPDDPCCVPVKEIGGASYGQYKGSLYVSSGQRRCSAEPCCCSLKTSDDPCCNRTIKSPKGPDDPCCVQVKETGGASYTQHKGSLDVSSGRRCCCAEPCCCSLKTSDDPCCNRTINSPEGPDDPCCVQVKETGGASYTQHKGSLDVSSGRRCCSAEPCCCSLKTSDEPCCNRTINSPKGSSGPCCGQVKESGGARYTQHKGSLDVSSGRRCCCAEPCCCSLKTSDDPCCNRTINSPEGPDDPCCVQVKETGGASYTQHKGSLDVSSGRRCCSAEPCCCSLKTSDEPCCNRTINSPKGSSGPCCGQVKESGGARYTQHKGSLDVSSGRRCCCAEPCCCSLKTSDDPCCNRTINSPEGPDDPCCVQVKETGGASYTQRKGSLDVSSGRRCCSAEPCCCSLKTSDEPCCNRTINSPKGSSGPCCGQVKESGVARYTQHKGSLDVCCGRRCCSAEPCCCSLKTSDDPCWNRTINSPEGSAGPCCGQVKESGGARYTQHKGSLDVSSGRRCCSAEPCCCSLKTSDDPCWNRAINSPKGSAGPCCGQVKESGGARYTQHKASLDVCCGRRCCSAEPCSSRLKKYDNPCCSQTIDSPNKSGDPRCSQVKDCVDAGCTQPKESLDVF